MFSISIKTESGVDVMVLQDDLTGTTAEIIPACGGILHAFTVQHQGRTWNVVDSDDPAVFAAGVEAKGFKSCKLSPFACRLHKGQYQFGGQSYRVNSFYLGDHALHGLLYNAPFSVWMQEVTETAAAITLLHVWKGTDSGYPFAYDCYVTYTLEANNRLTLTTRVVNQSGGLLPMQDGWHPYFTLGRNVDELQLEFQSKEMVLFDDTLIPTGTLAHYEEFGSLRVLGNTSFDNCFTVNFAECQPLCVLRNATDAIQLEIIPDNSYPYLQVYTPPHRRSIALENLSAAPDAFNNAMGLRVLTAGETAVFTTAYKITTLI